jgi:PPOX class probable F420-dependent enzyme
MRRRVGASRLGRLATLRADGSPHLVPFCFVLEGDSILSAVDRKPKRSERLARVANVARDARVAVLVDEWSEDWSRLWWVRVDGRARVLEPGAETQAALGLLAAKYEQYRRDPPPGPVLAIAAERWSGWSAT